MWAGGFEPPGDWADQASCRDSGWPDAWFPEKTGTVSAASSSYAKSVCSGCPVRADCLEYALRHESGVYRWGIYGGLSPRQRHRLAGGRQLRAVP